jgi:hypothetical protein
VLTFGSRSTSKLLATLYFVCRNCGNPAAQQLVKRGTWFTLFFIPVIPLKFSHSTTCTFCGVHTKVTKAEADQMLAANAGGAPQQGAPGQPQGGYPQPGQPQQQGYGNQPPAQS